MPERDDDPTDADIERFGGVTRTCPECKTEVYDDAEVCWKCGHAFSRVAQPSSRTTWIVTGIIVLLVVVLTLTQIF